MSLTSFLPSIISAGANIIGGLLGKSGQESANDTNIQLGREQMDFQERMSSSAYQRATADMQAAGLNPMLAYAQGGASSPVGSMPQVQNANQELGRGVSSAGGAAQLLGAQIEVQKASAELARANADKVRSETVPQEMNAYLRDALGRRASSGASLDIQRALTESRRPELVETDTRLKKVLEAIAGVQFDRDNTSFSADVARRKAESDLRVLDVPRMKAEDKFYEDLGKANPYLRQFLMYLNAVSGARDTFRR